MLVCCSVCVPSLSVLSPHQAKAVYGGWLLLAPEGTNFENPLHRSRVSTFILDKGLNVFMVRVFSILQKAEHSEFTNGVTVTPRARVAACLMSKAKNATKQTQSSDTRRSLTDRIAFSCFEFPGLAGL